MQIFDASGNLVLDASHRSMRIIDSVVLDGSNGSRSDPRMVSGGFVSFQPDRYIGYLSGGTIHPQFSFNNGTLSWTYSAKHSAQYDEYQTGTLFYGAY
ncbi:hypothetical protein [Caballeronia sp. AZ7_KS35]|uniref:hypothetical protein n=1 Tax=Caballeronia sp. AZ7_KS35 TaxID=2921762 RepID=UPI00202780CF|nr:hypothetical protein [Caballeronia sp. AZ7_KS35]